MRSRQAFKSRFQRSVTALILVLGLGSSYCAGKSDITSGAGGGRDSGSWSSSMQGMAKNLEQVLPYVFSREEYSDPNNKAVIKKLLNQFNDGVKQVPKHAGEQLLGKDPIVKYSLNRLAANAARGELSFNDGQIEYSRGLMRESIGLCFSCHTTQNLGPQFNFSTKGFRPSFRQSANEKADYYVATRQFDRAIDNLDAVVQSPAALIENPHEQLNALRKYLYLQVRVKNNPDAAIALLDKYLSWDKLPYFMATDAKAWQSSLRDWKQEMNRKTQSDSVSKASQLIKKAKRMEGMHSGLVDYLRASKILHESLRESNSKVIQSQTYKLLGDSYQVLAEMGIWDLPEMYYEACIRVNPKSAEAQSCYKEFERTILFGYTGSAGIFVPKDEKMRMNELRLLSGLQ